MLKIQIAGGLGNQMQQYSVYTKLRAMGKDVKLDLSWFDPEVQKNMLAPREFELPIFGGVDYEECSAYERDALLKQGVVAALSGKVLKKLGLRDEANPKVFSEKEMYHPEIFELEDKYIKGYFACQKYYGDIMDTLQEKFTFPEHSDPDLHARNMALVERMESNTKVN